MFFSLKAPLLVSPGRKVPRLSVNDRQKRKSMISRGRRSSCVNPPETTAYPDIQLLAEDCPEIANKIERLESYRKSLLNEHESSAKLVADAKAEYEESLRDIHQPSEFDIADLPLNQRSVLQGSLNYESILQTLLQYRQMTNVLADAFRQSAHKEAISLDQQLRMLRIEVQATIERRKRANCWES
ncbi:hypothetical protein M514_03686 [Trichuris suis]|uniref:Uncharacterized protein n=1 Tax=Trichuris suis TaxID=68888 RepID=A0A085NGS4_9BILA|nr:hypothetical protein M513_03686 [Trichuris suis]KFD68670.1 hypothetical protein M514_03686 [Trichuris suis]